MEIESHDQQNLHKTDLPNHVRTLDQGFVEEQLLISEHHKNLGNAAMIYRDYEEAVIQYSEAIKLNPKNAVHFCKRAAAYNQLENTKEAITDCEHALIIDPKCSEAYDTLGIIYSGLNNWEEAVKAYQQSSKCNPQNTSSYVNLRIATEHLIDTMESAAPPHHRPIHITQFINHESFLSLAREMTVDVDFQNIMMGIMVINQTGGTISKFFSQRTRICPAKCRTKAQVLSMIFKDNMLRILMLLVPSTDAIMTTAPVGTLDFSKQFFYIY